jgi:hypothetical protein
MTRQRASLWSDTMKKLNPSHGWTALTPDQRRAVLSYKNAGKFNLKAAKERGPSSSSKGDKR